MSEPYHTAYQEFDRLPPHTVQCETCPATYTFSRYRANRANKRHLCKRCRCTQSIRPKPQRVRDGAIEFQCSKCKRWLPVAYFYPSAAPASRAGIRSACKLCDGAAVVAKRKGAPQ